MGIFASTHRGNRHALTPALWLLLLTPAMALAGPADKIYEPHSVKGEIEFELRGGYEDVDQGSNPYQLVFDLGYGVSDRWLTELVVKYEDSAPGGDGKISDLEWENILVLTEPGRYWLDLGIFSELEYETKSDDVELVIGPMFQKQIGQEQFNFNLLFERKLENNTDTELLYRAQWKHRASRSLEYGLQAFGELGALNDLGAEEEHKLGPALFGSFKTNSHNKLSWDMAVLAGINESAPDISMRFELEYELY
ncbi:MAG: hypothetical protein PF630_06550 [Gammaproteobacteria bacterium]|jgi:hypothetical protein|nr:hypothetical protein [Gammaproteobacteria bacterium]